MRPLLVLVVVESAVVLAELVADAARLVGVVEGVVVREPTQVVDQAQQVCLTVAAGFVRWKTGFQG